MARPRTSPQPEVPGLAARRIAADIVDGVLRRRIALDEQLAGKAAHPGLATLADRDSGGRAVAPHDDSPLFEDTSHAPFVGRDAERGQFAHRLDAALEVLLKLGCVLGRRHVGTIPSLGRDCTANACVGNQKTATFVTAF